MILYHKNGIYRFVEPGSSHFCQSPGVPSSVIDVIRGECLKGREVGHDEFSRMYSIDKKTKIDEWHFV